MGNRNLVTRIDAALSKLQEFDWKYGWSDVLDFCIDLGPITDADALEAQRDYEEDWEILDDREIGWRCREGTLLAIIHALLSMESERKKSIEKEADALELEVKILFSKLRERMIDGSA